MKQTVLMVLLTALGAGGALFVEPFYGVAVYYLFAVLRPQYMWEWSLPVVAWSWYVAIASILAAIGMAFGMLPLNRVVQPFAGFRATHKMLMVFGAWVSLTYFTAYSQDAGYFYFEEYQKIFVMFLVSAVVIRSIRHVWIIYLLTGLSLGYIAYEMNYLYFVNHRLDIYHSGYGGVDNNGAGLMLAVGVPICIYAWEAARPMWRWAYIAFVPLLLHAIMMSYSRGAMVAMVIGLPLIIVRTKRRKQFAMMALVLAWMVPIMAGPEIRREFFSSSEYSMDDSANSRFASWNAGYQMANDHPFFGVGLRNSSLFSYQYGADVPGRVIHSQYLQILADNGYPGLFFYLLMLLAAWMAIRRARKGVKGRTDDEAQKVRAMVSGIECGLVVFLIAAVFLSVELFELPYVLLLMAAQLDAIVARDNRLAQEEAALHESMAGPRHSGRRDGPFAAPAPGAARPGAAGRPAAAYRHGTGHEAGAFTRR